ncbi:MAG: AraC family transcriptional regulator [Eubacteriales bacterium]|nr:AraC family transcriptional regulator [Eubacteriales bacterium]
MKKQILPRLCLSTRRRIYCSYIFICGVLGLLLMGLLTGAVCRSQQREESSRQTYTARMAASALDASFSGIQNLGHQLSESQWVKRRGAAPGLYDGEFDLYKRRSICDDLRGYVSSGVIQRLSVVFPGKGEVYSSSGFYRAEDFFHTFSLERGQEPLSSQVVYGHIRELELFGLVRGDRLGMTGNAANALLYVESLEYNRPMRCFLLVEINRSALRNQIELLRSGDMVGVSIEGLDGELLRMEFSDGTAETEIACRSTCFPVDIRSCFARPPVLRMGSIWFLTAVALLCAVLIVNLSRVLTNLTYSPLERLVSSVSNRVAPGQTVTDEYRFLEESVSRLYSAHENVLRRAEQYRAVARENVLRRLLQGYYDPAAAEEKLREFEIGFSDAMYYTVFLVENGTLGHGMMPLEEALSAFDYPYEIAELSKTRLAAIVGAADAEAFSDQVLLRRVELSYREYARTLPLIFWGSVQPGLAGIARSYASASEHLTAWVRAAETDSRSFGFYYPMEWELQLINRVTSCQLGAAEKMLKDLRAENEKRGTPPKFIRQLVLLLAQTYSRMVNELSSQPGDYDPLFAALDQAPDPDGLWQALYAINERLCGRSTPGEKSRDLEQQLLEYVKDHLTDPELSLKDLSARFDLSVSAVSKLFKRVCGINLYDYMLSNRMKLACELLENKNLSLSAVAHGVGYDNEYSFRRAFNRFYGVSVGEYFRKRRS